MLNPKIHKALKFASGHEMHNRFMLAPMTNQQSKEDGTLSDDELHWLKMRAKGGFGLISTCASHVDEIGKGFSGQLGIFNDKHIEGHKKLAATIREHDSLAIVQLHHAGMRSPKKLISGQAVAPSDLPEFDARALSLDEVYRVRDKFIEAAIRAKKSEYDGVQIHGAHSYLLCQFLSQEHNKRQDEYGGSLENRVRLIKEIIAGIRETCGNNFLLSLRLSPERMGMRLEEIKTLSLEFEKDETLDFLDISLWDSFKLPEEEKHQNKSLLAHFTSLELKHTKLTVAGKIYTGKDVHTVMNNGIDFVSIGKAGILHHDFPKQVIIDSIFEMHSLPVNRDYLKSEGLGEKFIDYMSRWEGFVKPK
jgi:2,4-dienoyl-CoA reductase-like NADH-dependent reductase (Old Yellow Enzyme family)